MQNGDGRLEMLKKRRGCRVTATDRVGKIGFLFDTDA